MPTTAQMLTDYPDVLIQVLGELRGAFLDAADSRHEAVQLLAAQITDPTSIQFAFQEVIDMADAAKDALATLLRESGEMTEAQFSREFGAIRQMGPAKLERESPWLYPESVAEILYYYGLLGRGFKGLGREANAIVYIPSDVMPWLPQPQNSEDDNGLPLAPVPPPPAARTIPADTSFLADMGTLLGFIHTDKLRIMRNGPNAEDVERLVERLQFPFTPDDADLNTRLALMLHLANRLGWLRRGDDEAVQLTGNSVRMFLERTPNEQRAALFAAWRDSPDWNDLCRTPGLECRETGAWQNNPLQTRTNLLHVLGRLQREMWYSQADVIAAVKQVEPDFQRPAGNYDTWYIRDLSTQEFLKGFEKWDAVEGLLIGFLLQGPLHWLGIFDVAEPSAGDDMQVALTPLGARWLGQEADEPAEPSRRPLQVGDDFTIRLDVSTALAERFRVERFANWTSSYPHYVYQMNQRSLKRAQEEGIPADRILAFLQQRARAVPDNVASALTKMAASGVSSK